MAHRGGWEGRRSAPVFATFNDNVAGFETAPDAGSAVGLLFLPFSALFGASRLRLLQST
jgi:hypothetical protein